MSTFSVLLEIYGDTKNNLFKSTSISLLFRSFIKCEDYIYIYREREIDR